MKSIRVNFLFIFIFIISILISLIVAEYYTSKDIKLLNDSHLNLKELQVKVLQMRRAEKDFLLRLDNKYSNKLVSISESIQDTLVNTQSELYNTSYLSSLSESIYDYKEIFSKIAKLKTDIGLNEDSGLRGQFRSDAHALEESFNNSGSLDLKILLLQLRRSEKDFFMRLDEKYLQIHKDIFKTLKEHKLDSANTILFNNYEKGFLSIVDKLKTIGLNENLSLHAKMRHTFNDIESALQEQVDKIIPLISTKYENLQTTKYVIYFILLLMLVVIFNLFIRPVDKAFLYFKSFFENFKGASERIDIDKLDFQEFKDISTTVNSMLNNIEIYEKDLIDSRDEAIELRDAKDQFLTNMSHELRTPLNAIIGFSTILKNTLPEQHKTINPIVESSKHLLLLINDILDISKIQSGKFSINDHIFEIKQNIENFLTQYEYEISNKNINFTFNSNINEKTYVNSDWLRISQVMHNFLSNAMKFTPNGGDISLTINFENKILTVSVQDSGIGISSKSMNEILKPFIQADSSTTKDFGGTGLGLSIANAIVTLMYGEISIESEEGKGSTFTFEIPLEVSDKEEVIAPKNDLLEEDTMFKAHVLVAEDNKTNQLLIGMLLEDMGITYDIANDGLEAVEMYKDDTYDLILMDENMPKMSGVDAMIEIKKSHKNFVPIIAVTANVMKGDEDRLIEAGMDGFVPKPIENKELISVLSKFLS